uniref:ClpC n=1 Tax=Apicomplexa sp. WK-2018_Corallicola TaxID=2304055 RepID=A0A346KN76_9APIC|nr:ClpC [Apicomplexa sp. WK-2018_Corallicola]
MNTNTYTKLSTFQLPSLKCTKEVLLTLAQAETLATKYKYSYVEPIHIFTSLFYTKLSSNLALNLRFKDQLLLELSLHRNTHKTSAVPVQFSLTSLTLLSNLTKKISSRPFNTLDLFYLLLEESDLYLPEIAKTFEKELNILLTNFETHLEESPLTKESSNNELLLKISSNLSDIISSSYNIIGRKTETLKLIEILSRKTKRNPIILGPEGVGRLSLIKALAAKIKRNEVPLALKNKELWMLNINSLIKYTTYKGELEQQFEEVINSIKPNAKSIVLVCPDIELLFNLNNSSEEGINTLINTLKPALEKNYIQFIGTSTSSEYEKFINKNSGVDKYFDKLTLAEPSEEVTFKIIKDKVKSLEEFHKVSILSDTIKEVINLSKQYLKHKTFPEKALILLDVACAKINCANPVSTQFTPVTTLALQQAASDLSGLPAHLIIKTLDTVKTDATLTEKLNSRVFGQSNAISKISNALKRASTGLKPMNKPIGSWLLCGPSGTGKTELAKSLANFLFGSDTEMVRFDMSEFMEKHSVSRLIGSPPGYIGYGEGGQLTEAVNKKPYTVVLFDEIEKAHADVNNLMLQLLDDGRLTDSSGKSVDFSNTIILFTSNLGCPTNPLEFKSFQEGSNFTKEEYLFLSNKVNTAVQHHFRPEFINRLDGVVVFQPLSINYLTNIVDKFLDQISSNLKRNGSPLCLSVSPEVKHILAKIAYQPLYGARPLKRLIANLIETPISDILLNYKVTSPHVFSLFFDKNNTLGYGLKKLD